MQLNFDANTVAPTETFAPLPPGFYPVKIIESENKPTKDGNGSYLQLTLEVLGGEFAGRKLFDRLNLNNANQTAVEIAYRTLSAICHATGVIQVQDSSQLHGMPMEAKVKLKPADGNYEASNEISGYRAIQGAAPAQQAPAQQMPQQPVQQTQPAQPVQQPMQQPVMQQNTSQATPPPAWGAPSAPQESPQVAATPAGSPPPWATPQQ